MLMVSPPMKSLRVVLGLAGVGLVVLVLWASHQQADRLARELATERASWESERSQFHNALNQARAGRAAGPIAPRSNPPPPPTAVADDPQALLNQLIALPIKPGQTRAARHALALLDQLAQAGPSALPAIRQFLATGQDVAYESLGGKGPRDIRSLTDALVPASLRFALFDVARQIGGTDAENLLAENLGRSTRGIEVAYLSQALDELAPGQYQTLALETARTLLSGNSTPDRLDRDYLFGVLRRFNDPSYVPDAQAQLVQADGRLDVSALRYLQQTLGPQSVALAARTYQDNRITELGSKEPLARLALAYVGTDLQAAELFHTAALDPSLTPDQRRNLIEDLNQDGLINRKIPTPEDLPIVAQRYALTQAYLTKDYVLNDQLLSAAFREADKDLRNLLDAAAAAAAKANPAPPKP